MQTSSCHGAVATKRKKEAFNVLMLSFQSFQRKQKALFMP
jgi:hypothetical protein